MRLVGALAVIFGGLIAAVTGPLELTKGSWAAAYLVLVAGVAQVMMGSARRRWRREGADASGWWQLTLWNLGHVGVIGGTVAGSTPVVVGGSVPLVLALVLALLASLRSPDGGDRMLLSGYRLLLVLLAVSIPVGMLLSAVRNS